MPKITVIIPTYNRTTVLRRAVNSVLNQHYQDFEILIIDDCSTEDMKETWDSFTDPRIKIIQNKMNLQAGPSRNKGADLAQGEYIAFLDSDDEWLPGHLEVRLSMFMTNPDLDGVYGASTLYTDGILTSEPPVCAITPDDSMLNYLLSGRLRASTPSLMMKKSAFNDIKFDESLVHHEDYNFLIRFHERYTLGCVPSSTVMVHESTTAHSLGKHVNHKSCLQAIDAYTQDVEFKHLFNYCKSMASDAAIGAEEKNQYLVLLNNHIRKRPISYVLKHQLWKIGGMKSIRYIEIVEWFLGRLNKSLVPTQ